MKEALRLALEALKTIDDAMPFPVAKLAIKKCTAALEAKNEPVAWNTGIPSLHPKMKEGETISVEYVELTPPQRTWVALTDEDLKPLSDKWRIVYGGWVEDFAKEIEAKLRSKNTWAI